jgi:sec-independent protein translocase protein TatB
MSLPDTIFILLAALLLFGPKKLPEIARQVGKLMAELRRASNEFKFQMEDELRQSEEADRRKKAEAATAAANAAQAATAAANAATSAAVAATAAADSAAAAANAAAVSSTVTTPAPAATTPAATAPSVVTLELPSTGAPIANRLSPRAADLITPDLITPDLVTPDFVTPDLFSQADAQIEPAPETASAHKDGA